jgi:hypothetical protein
MMKAYSLDFREKIIDAHFMERVSLRKLALSGAENFFESHGGQPRRPK